MEPPHHLSTSSHGTKGADGVRWRAIQKALIDQGNFGEAMQKDIDDIRARYGNKYDEAIREMIQSLDPWMREGLRG
jgi:filamentous hemagglutinin